MSSPDADPFEYPGHDLESPHANQLTDTLEHVRVRNDGPDELILIPADATETELATAWVTATGAESFTDLDDAR